MKVLFCNPPTFDREDSFFRPVRFPTFNYATPVMHPPLYLAYAAAYVRDRGHEVLLLDAPVNGITVDEFITDAVSWKPELVVFETSTPSFSNDCRVAEQLKAACSDVPLKVVFVGTHVTALPHEALAQDVIDAIVLGEFEFSLTEYIEKGPEHTPGIGYRNSAGECVINEARPFCTDMDTVPMPARDFLPNEKYFDPILKNPFTFVISGRGCPYPCTFCNWPKYLTGRTVRKRSVEKIVDELEHVFSTYAIKSILFNDDTFTADKKHACAVADEIMKRGLKIQWACYARADTDDDELLQKLRDAGCFMLKIGIETADEAIQKNVKKNYDLQRVRAAVKKMKRYGYHVHGTFAFGLPGETHETIKKTVRFAKELDPTTVQFSIAVPYPGTEFFEYLDKEGYLLTKNWDEYMPLNKIYEYPHLSYEDMQTALKKAYRSFYFRPKYVFVGLGQFIAQPTVFLGNAKKLFKLVFGKEK